MLDGAAVQVSGVKVGQVRDIDLDGPRVLVTFTVDDDIAVGDRSEAAIKTKSLLGAKFLELTPRGEGSQAGTIPVERTSSPYQLPDALGDLDRDDQRPQHRPGLRLAAGVGGHLQRHPAPT